MYTSNEIAALKNITVKPMSWRITKLIDNTYQLEFTYIDKSRNEYALIQASKRSRQYGKYTNLKIYKTINAVFSDIEKVQANATVYFIGLSDNQKNEETITTTIGNIIIETNSFEIAKEVAIKINSPSEYGSGETNLKKGSRIKYRWSTLKAYNHNKGFR